MPTPNWQASYAVILIFQFLALVDLTEIYWWDKYHYSINSSGICNEFHALIYSTTVLHSDF